MGDVGEDAITDLLSANENQLAELRSEIERQAEALEMFREEQKRDKAEILRLQKDSLTRKEAERAWWALAYYDTWNRPEYAEFRAKLMRLRRLSDTGAHP